MVLINLSASELVDIIWVQRSLRLCWISHEEAQNQRVYFCMHCCAGALLLAPIAILQDVGWTASRGPASVNNCKANAAVHTKQTSTLYMSW